VRLDQLFALADMLGRDHGGVLTAPRLRMAEADPDTVRQVVKHHWQVPVRGVYVPHRLPLSDAEMAHVALAHAGPEAVLSGAPVARRLAMRWIPEDLHGYLALVPPSVTRVSSEGLVLVRRCAGVGAMRTWSWEGIPMAPPAQVVVDTCRQLLAVRRSVVGPRGSRAAAGTFERNCLRDIRGIVLGAVADGYCTAAELRELVDLGAMRDSALIRRACVDAARGAVSPPEAELVDGLLECGVLFACNVEVRDGNKLVAVLDVHLVGTGVGGELDSKDVHERADLLDATLLRHDRVETYGLKLCHTTPTRYRADPAQFHERLFAQARDRLARGFGDPPGLRYVPRGPVIRGPRASSPPYRLPGSRHPRAA
jgi:hypothetical protein